MQVSVLMPVFNTATYLRAALQSISAQTLRDWELIVVDDGSSDASRDVLEEYAGLESRMRLVSRANRGVIATRNELVELASGEFIAWMDSDDIAVAERLEKQSNVLNADKLLVCVGTDAQNIDPDGALLNLERFPPDHDSILAEQRSGSGFRFPTTMMRRDAVLAVAGFREPFSMGEDLDLLIRLGEHGRLANIPDALYLYRQHPGSVTASLSPRWTVYREHILELARQRREGGADTLQCGGSLVIPPVERADARRAASSTYAYWSRCALEHRDRRRALRYAVRAVAGNPWSGQTWRSLVDAAAPLPRR